MSTPSGPSTVTGSPAIHKTPTQTPFSDAAFLQQLQSMVPALVEDVLAEVLLAVAGISIFGIKPFAGLTVWADALEAKASNALATAQGAQSTATTAGNSADQANQVLDSLISGIPGASQIEDVVDYLTGNGDAIATIQDDLGGIGGTISTVEDDLGQLGDTIYNAITDGGNGSGISFGAIGSELQKLASKAQTALTSAANAFNVTQTFGGLLHQVVEDLEESPVYQGPLDFLEQIGSVVGTLWNNIVTSLSPQNPGTVANTGQINAIWAHLSSGTSGIRVAFASGTPLSANYPTTTNPSFTAPTSDTGTFGGSFALPTVVSGESYLETAYESIGVFTGNPSGLTNGDHGLATDRVHAEMTLMDLLVGTSGPFICGHGTTALAQHVALELQYNTVYGHTLSIVSYTAPDAGRTSRATVNLTTFLGRAPAVNDVFAIEYDGTSVYAMFINGSEVTGSGTMWTDSGGAITHGPGYRECGVKVALGSNGSALNGPGLGLFVAYDF